MTVLYVPYMSYTCAMSQTSFEIYYTFASPAPERRGDNLKGFKGFHLKNGSSQGQDLALTVLYVPCSLDSGAARGEGALSRAEGGKVRLFT